MATKDGSVGFAIGEVSRAVGLAPQTLRLWERERLITPRRTDRGYRVYTESDVESLLKIKNLRQAEGLNFAAIRKLLGPQNDNSSVHESNGFPEAENGAKTPGERLRRLRMKSHKTLREVSESTGLSISFISALERGGSGASISSLRLLADCFGVNMRNLFGVDLDQRSLLMESEKRPSMKWDNGIRFEEMTSGERAMDPTYIKVPPGSGSEGFYSHEGEEFVYVISGVLHFDLKEQGVYAVGPGDTLYFHSTTPHRWWAGDKAVEAIYVNTPPTF